MMGGPQQLYHLDAYIPLRINSEESKAAFHRKRKVPGEIGGGVQGSGGTGEAQIPESSFSVSPASPQQLMVAMPLLSVPS